MHALYEDLCDEVEVLVSRYVAECNRKRFFIAEIETAFDDLMWDSMLYNKFLEFLGSESHVLTFYKEAFVWKWSDLSTDVRVEVHFSIALFHLSTLASKSHCEKVSRGRWRSHCAHNQLDR